jgi:hypothetical protein
MILTPPNQTRLGGNHNIFYLYSVRYIVVLHNQTFQDQTSNHTPCHFRSGRFDDYPNDP